ncbi:hypothetical protein [Sphingopyxis macrogoltabida]|uniref:DUF1475 domain-containing protein n=1 Tax=Sphingopyxis macrogoltabida TaxID=33050 RepID=A0A0N9USF1_SPHMC|nr:hypothetical protein [Sphingopyxis macrogoltabida]ALH82876.1 hypothetical protein AN936_21710 [Sphingopyxis macrogoltabida]
MIWFRVFLAACLLSILIYTGVTIGAHGWNLLPIFFGDMAAMAWPGQFNFDFFTFLLLSGIWTAWRIDFSLGGLALGLIAVLGGMLFLSIYLLTLSYQHQGDIGEMMLGAKRMRK